MFQLRQGTSLGGFCDDQPLFLGQLHGRSDDLVDVPHGFGAQALSLMLALNSVHPAFFQQLLVELLQFQRSELFQGDFADIRLDVVVDVPPVGLVRRWSHFYLCVVLKPLVHPGTYCVFPGFGDVQIFGFLDGRFQFGLCLCLGPAQDVLVDGFAGFRIVPGGVAALPSTVFSLSDVPLSVGAFLRHGIRLLFNDTTYHREQK